ncbi:Permease of the drug/metabolite transporter (DMT) superfamily [Handroanthus impetiginosus]|uniref:WAT1-related protein n=1 Tax=Handroanthus impetiginosus TaxID=429701 RepID=A0A2G9GXA5_9LAMI|nr:Permease of the drug/metabolite transporter (DMT) superfamily [Handroanthus impetiginosus]
MVGRGLRSWIESSLPFMGMVLAVTALATNMIISKMAMSNGTSFFVLSVYSNVLATLILFPCGFLFHRSKRPPLTFPVLCRIFLLACFGCLADIGSYAGIRNSSPTLASELLNLVPGFTYILAIIFRMEGLNLKRLSDISKILGTLVSIVGASIVTLYKGPAIMKKALTLGSSQVLSPLQQNWVLGGILLTIAAFSTAAWSIVQTSILKIYPAEMIIVAIYCIFVTLQSTVAAVIAEKDLTAWKLQAEMGWVAVFFAGIINITLRLYLMSWCLSRTGPLFVSLFNPLTIVVSVVIGVIFFHEVLYFGSVAGAVILVIGFYAVIWGKARESKMKRDAQDVESTSHQDPLLQDSIEEA